MSVRLCVIAPTRMEAISAARVAGIKNAEVELDRLPPQEAVLAALETRDGVVWQDWFGTLDWQGLASIPR